MPGRTISHYEVLEQLGQGGMGVVYKARDTRLDRLVALKILPPESVRDPERRRRFVNEARSASALNHPNIVAIYDIDSTTGVDFIAMEYVGGSTLEDLIGRKGLPLNQALGYGAQIADALSKAHAAGIIHRDLKPANVMVTPEGQVKVLDFGLAKLVEPEESPDDAPTMTASEQKITKEGRIVGTLAYMSPEQAEGKHVDARTDVFSFGAMLYQMLTGERPFKGSTQLEVATALLREDPKAPSQIRDTIPGEVERAVLRCLRKDPQRRWQNMSDLKVALEDLKEESDSGTLTALTPAHRRGSRVWMIATAGLLVLLVLAAILAWRAPRTAAPTQYELTRLTFEPGVGSHPAISRDGKLLAFASDRNGNTDIYVQQINGRQASRLTDDPANDSEPSFSPDGTRIVFSSARDGGGIYVVDTMGGPQRRLADRGRQARYSPDGTIIAYVVPSAFSTTARMFLIPAEGGTPQPFQPEFQIPLVGPFWPPPMWSPDGKYLLFRAVRGQDWKTLSWWVAPVAGGEAVAVKPPALTRPAIQAPELWAGKFVYYFEGTTFGGVSLYRVPISGDPWQLGTPERLTSGSGVHSSVSISSDGRLVFNLLTFQMAPWVAGFDGDAGVVKGAAEQLPSDTSGKLGMAVASNGSKMAYGAFVTSPERTELRIRDLRTGREDVLPSPLSITSPFPHFSPDGSKLAYRARSGSKTAYYLADSSGNSTQICENCSVRGFFPDGAEVVVAEAKRLVRHRIADALRTPLVETPNGVAGAAISPDGKRIAFNTANAAGDSVLYIAAIAGQPTAERDWIKVAEDRRLLSTPQWSPDGSLLYYIAARDGFACLWAQRVARDGRPQGEPFAAFHSHQLPSLYFGQSYSVTRDHLYLALGDVKGNIWSLQVEKQ